MSVGSGSTAAESLSPGASRNGGRGRRTTRLTWSRMLIAAAVVLALLSLVRVVTGAEDLTSSGTTGAMLRLAVPIGLAGLGGLWSERAGVVNIGLEGMMILGSWFGAYVAYETGDPWLGIVAGLAGGMAGGLLHGIATVTFGVDHIVSGVAVTILAAGATEFLSVLAYRTSEAEAAGGGETQSPPLPEVPSITLPGISGALLEVENQGWFFVSDLAGVLRGATTNVSWLIVIAVLLVVLTYFVLWRTSFGLRLRSSGENPVAAESLGVNVYRMKYAGVLVSGAMAGLGGAFLAIVAAGIYREGQIAGRGYIGLAAMIFGNWRPGGLVAGAGLFGYTDALQLRQGGTVVHALLLFLAIVLALVAAWQVTRSNVVRAAVSLGVALGVFVVFLVTSTVPEAFVTMTPYVTTLLVLSLASQRLRMPAADGVPYRRGQAR
jgi:general nucleoside transport system permease protein